MEGSQAITVQPAHCKEHNTKAAHSALMAEQLSQTLNPKRLKPISARELSDSSFGRANVSSCGSSDLGTPSVGIGVKDSRLVKAPCWLGQMVFQVFGITPASKILFH